MPRNKFGRNKTGEYVLSVECIKSLIGYLESAFSMGFEDHNVWRAVFTDGIPGDTDLPEDVYKLDSVDLITVIRYLSDHRRRLDTALEMFQDGIEARDLDVWGADTLYLDVIECARENRPGPFSRSELKDGAMDPPTPPAETSPLGEGERLECEFCGRTWIMRRKTEEGNEETDRAFNGRGTYLRLNIRKHVATCATRSPKKRRHANRDAERKWRIKPPTVEAFNNPDHPGLYR